MPPTHSAVPTEAPSGAPSYAPTNAPFESPTPVPSMSFSPSALPTPEPTYLWGPAITPHVGGDQEVGASSDPGLSGPDRGDRGTGEFTAHCVCHDELLDVTYPDFLATRLPRAGIDFHLGRMAVQEVWNVGKVVTAAKDQQGGAYADAFTVIETESVVAAMQVLWDDYAKPVCKATGELLTTSNTCVVHMYK